MSGQKVQMQKVGAVGMGSTGGNGQNGQQQQCVQVSQAVLGGQPSAQILNPLQVIFPKNSTKVYGFISIIYLLNTPVFSLSFFKVFSANFETTTIFLADFYSKFQREASII